MALNLLTYPGEGSAVTNEMLFCIEETTKADDPTNYPNYKFVADIYYNSVLVARLKANPHPTTYLGIFNVAPILRNYVTYGLDALYAETSTVVNPRGGYQIRFGEEYNDTLYTDLLVDTTRQFFKSYCPRPTESSQTIDSDTIVSNLPSTIYSYKSTKFLLMSVYDTNFVDDLVDVTITLYNSSGGVVTTITYADLPATDDQFVQFNVGWQKIVAVSSLSQAMQDATEYYTVSVLGNTRTVRFLCDAKYDPYTLAFLNPYGAYDTYTFGLVSKKEIEVERKEFSQLPYQINSTGTVSYSANGVMYGSRRTYASTVKTRMKFTSHLLNAEEYTWLADLFISTDVYLYFPIRVSSDDTDRFIPVKIVETNYEYRDYLNSRLTALTFVVEFSDTYNGQFL